MTPHEGPEPPAATPFWKRRRWQAAGGALLALLAAFLFLTWALPLGRALEPLSTPTLVLTDSDRRPFARRGAYKEAPVEVKELPGHVTGAFLAIEDRRFYSHFGLDLAGIARAARDNLRAGGVAQGGSTITQQLAKNAFLSNERSWRRKAQEALIALYLEARLSKDEIFSRYLSAVYFGDGVFGLRAAARHYFDKEPEALSIGEAAMLAGLVKAPSRLAPTEDLAAARARARVVLAAMVETGVISEAQARAARNVRLREGRADLPVGTYFADWITREARRGFDRAYGEIEARTTLDSRLQSQAERIVERALARQGGALNAGQAALVAMRTDGRVVAMVGGRDYAQSQFNRAVDAQRQPGSAFKLFVYQAAIRQGWTPDREILDAPVKVGDWEPENHEARYAGRPISLRRAFAGSSNVAAVRLAREVGTDPIIRAARDMGVSAPLTRDLTLALGTSPMSLLELTAAYAAVAAGEAPIRPYGLAGRAPAGERRVLPAGEREALRDLLRAVVTQGTGRAAGVSGAHGKTGTTQDYRDALFVGYAGDLVVGVWIGNDDNSPMRRAVGGGLPAQIWRDFVAAAQPRRPSPPEPEEEAEDTELLETEPLIIPPVDPAAPEPPSAEPPLAEPAPANGPP